MTYNIHPLFVHFPIALLFLYSAIKILPWERWFPQLSWQHVRIIFLTIGVLGAFAALSTGETAEYLIRPNHQLVETHSTFATLSTIFYCILLASELFPFIEKYIARKTANPPLFLKVIGTILCNRVLVVLLALIALITLSITGVLGGVMVYGTTADPVAPYILNIFGIVL